MNSAVFSQDWRSMKTALSRPCSLMATLTVVTALPAPVVNLSSGSAVKRPVMVTVFMVIPLLWVAVEKEKAPGKRRSVRGARRAEEKFWRDRRRSVSAASAARSCPQPLRPPDRCIILKGASHIRERDIGHHADQLANQTGSPAVPHRRVGTVDLDPWAGGHG